jgi:hypothetical protein
MPEFRRAKFTPLVDGKAGETFEVHFNPTSLDYSVTNTLQSGTGNRPAQYVAQSTGKLTMELAFDTTDSGEDVRAYTEKVARLMDPGGGGSSGASGSGGGGDQRRPPPVARFEWGAYKFEGVVESFREKIDFFSAEGVPLRASVNVGMTRQDRVFEPADKNQPTTVGTDLSSGEGAVEAPMGSSDDVDDVATGAGDPGAARDIAAANGFESIRAPGAAVVRLGASINLGPPLAFASGGAGFGIGLGGGLNIGLGGGLNIGLGGGLNVGLGAGLNVGGAGGLDLDFSAGASAGGFGAGGSNGGDLGFDAGGAGGGPLQGSPDLGTAGAAGSTSGAGTNGAGAASGGAARGGAPGGRSPGGAATRTGGGPGAAAGAAAAGSRAAGSERERGTSSAGVSATEGAFGALGEARGSRRRRPLDPESLVRSTASAGSGTGVGVGFRIGGQARALSASSVAADVGQNLRLSERIRFDRGGEGGE